MKTRIIGGIGLTVLVFFAAWVGCRVYVQQQAKTLLDDVRALDTSSDPTALSRTLAQKYLRHFVGRESSANYRADRFLFTNRVLSTFHLAPRTEISLTFEYEGNALRDVHVEYTSGIFKENSPIVAISENFCPNQPVGECSYFGLHPHGRNVSETWNGDVGFTQRVKPEVRRAGWQLNAECLTSFRGCKDVSELLPALWKSSLGGTVSSRMRSDSDSTAEAAQPLPD
jgi:hypothetical protein